MHKLVLASLNPGKIADFRELFSTYPVELIPQANLGVPEIAETGLTFVENALIKARHASRLTGLPSISDDSGLVVDALNGAPGLYSARYVGPNASDEENNQKLLNALAEIPNAPRTARFYCVIVLLHYPDDPAPLICEGTLEGEILTKPVGNNGFGYMPIFYVPSHHCSGAELSDSERRRINHRGQGFRELIKKYLEKIREHE